jgi:hypothetical protein
MYKKNIASDYYDNLKVAATHEKLIQKKRNSFVDIRRQKKRDFTVLLKGTDAFVNIQRDN